MSTTAVCNCATFDWGRVNFLLSSWYGAMFQICDESSVDNSRDVLVTAQQCLHRGKVFSGPHATSPASRGEEHNKLEGMQLGQLTPTNPREILRRLVSCLAYEAEGRRRMGAKGGNAWSDGFCLPKSPLLMMGFPGDGWTPACPWKVGNEFHVLLCSCAWLLLSWLNCHCLNPSVI